MILQKDYYLYRIKTYIKKLNAKVKINKKKPLNKILIKILFDSNYQKKIKKV